MTAIAPVLIPPGEGVAFPRSEGGRPSTATARAIFADAARGVDPDLADRITAAGNWRSDYVTFVHALTALSAASADAARRIARDGLGSMHRRMVFHRRDEDLPLDAALEDPTPGAFHSETISGTAERVAELRVPYQGRELSGPALIDQAERWVERKIAEPSFAAAIRRVVEHPEWLALPGRRVVLVGAASEIGPLEPLSAWGADVVCVDIPREDKQRRIDELARRGAGTVTVPVAGDGTRGADLLRALPEIRQWLDGVAGDGDLVLGMYAYADGALHVRVTAAFDALATDVLERRPGTALSYLATPTDAFVVTEDVVADSHAAWSGRGVRAVAQAPLRALSRGRLFAPAYAGDEPVADILVPQQGPNYALAKRLQRWRGVVASEEGHPVSFNVAPATWTRSVTKNRVLAAAYAGAHRFGVEVFQPDTCRVLMAALLVHDLHQPADPGRHPERLFSDGAAHGGLWRAAYEPRSVLGIAALTGLPSALLKR